MFDFLRWLCICLKTVPQMSLSPTVPYLRSSPKCFLINYLQVGMAYLPEVWAFVISLNSLISFWRHDQNYTMHSKAEKSSFFLEQNQNIKQVLKVMWPFVVLAFQVLCKFGNFQNQKFKNKFSIHVCIQKQIQNIKYIIYLFHIPLLNELFQKMLNFSKLTVCF